MIGMFSFLVSFILISLIDEGCLGCIFRFIFIIGFVVLLVNVLT